LYYLCLVNKGNTNTEQKILITAESKPLNIATIMGSDNYSIVTIRRKSDNKIFGCYFRNGSVKIIKEGDILGYKHWFIEKETGTEELCLYGVDQKVYDIIEVVED
jgi:hypothetical protein